jgi:hypothetical protein
MGYQSHLSELLLRLNYNEFYVADSAGADSPAVGQ